MKNWGGLKINCFNKKAQTLTELASFGSVLLLALSFLISYGMRLNYQQDVQMRAFRKALSEAYNPLVPRPDASASVVLLEDKHIPDPRDMFGAGNIIPAQAGAQVTWGNTMQDPDAYKDLTDYSRLPGMKYVLNNPKEGGKEVEYRTAGFGFVSRPNNPPYGSSFYAILPGNTIPQPIPWERLRCYQPTLESPKQAMILLDPAETDPKKMKKEVITEIYLEPIKTKTSTPVPYDYIKYQIIGVGPATAADGDLLTRLELLSPDSAEINPNYTQLGGDTGKLKCDASGGNCVPVYVTSDMLQGLLLDSKQEIKRRGELTVKETPGKTISTSNYRFSDKAGNPTIITHKIRTNSNSEPVNIPYTFERGRSSTWTTSK